MTPGSDRAAASTRTPGSTSACRPKSFGPGERGSRSASPWPGHAHRIPSPWPFPVTGWCGATGIRAAIAGGWKGSARCSRGRPRGRAGDRTRCITVTNWSRSAPYAGKAPGSTCQPLRGALWRRYCRFRRPYWTPGRSPFFGSGSLSAAQSSTSTKYCQLAMT